MGTGGVVSGRFTELARRVSNDGSEGRRMAGWIRGIEMYCIHLGRLNEIPL